MKDVRRMKRLADLDMEPLVGGILLRGVLLSMSLVVGGVAWQWAATGQLGVGGVLQGVNVFHFLLGDLRQVCMVGLRPHVLVDLGLVVLLLTPYVRVVASLAYFAWVERQGSYTLFTSSVFLTLTYLLLFG